MTGSGAWGALRSRFEALRESYWLLPGQMTLGAAILALAAVEIDRRAPPEWLERLPWLTDVSAAGARSVLSTIAGSMMTVTSVVFSITVVALTLTSSQFGPRLLRTFFRDRGSQLALGTFLATFVYSLLVLRAVLTPQDVPYVATAGAVVLAVVSLFVLVFFVHHAASSIQATSVIASVAREIHQQVPSLFPEEIGTARDREPSGEDRRRLEHLDTGAAVVRAPGEGNVRILDDDALLGLASEHDLLVRVDARPGRFVAEGAAVARVAPPEHASEEVLRHLAACWILGDHRTPMQDLRFLTDQLGEMAVRALSPGVNDPGTAIECVHRLGATIARLAERAMPSGLRFDADGTLRVVADPTRFDEILAGCLDPIRRHGAGDPQVTVALLEAVGAGADHCTDPDRARALETTAREILDAFGDERRGASKREVAAVESAFERVIRTLAAA